MPRRVSLPGASELFRNTHEVVTELEPVRSEPAEPSPEPSPGESTRRSTGRVRHDEKITVYVSSDELIALEQARLQLRADHRLAVDRGRIVREAISAAMADLADNGPSSELVRRLSAS